MNIIFKCHIKSPIHNLTEKVPYLYLDWLIFILTFLYYFLTYTDKLEERRFEMPELFFTSGDFQTKEVISPI
jgi:hypothetical protein